MTLARQAVLMLFLVATVTAFSGSFEDSCHEKATCEKIGDTMVASSMLQTKSANAKAGSLQNSAEPEISPKIMFGQTEVYLEKSKACISTALQEAHIQSVRRHAASMAMGVLRSGKQAPTWIGGDSNTMNKAKEACAGKETDGDRCSIFGRSGHCAWDRGGNMGCDIGQWSACKEAGTPCLEPGFSSQNGQPLEGQTGKCILGMKEMHPIHGSEYDCPVPPCPMKYEEHLSYVCELADEPEPEPEPEEPKPEEPKPEEPKPEEPKPEEPKPEPKPEQPVYAPHQLTAPAAAGTTVLPVHSNSGFHVGQQIVIDPDTAIEESNVVAGLGSIILKYPLMYDHGVGVTVVPASSKGASASLDAAGFKATTSLCCPIEMEIFFKRLLDSKGFSVCSWPHIQGLMHWFTCVPDMDFQYMIDVIYNGNPCKYWAPKGAACPELSAKCAGRWCR